jgi:hypothetical protein
VTRPRPQRQHSRRSASDELLHHADSWRHHDRPWRGQALSPSGDAPAQHAAPRCSGCDTRTAHGGRALAGVGILTPSAARPSLTPTVRPACAEAAHREASVDTRVADTSISKAQERGRYRKRACVTARSRHSGISASVVAAADEVCKRGRREEHAAGMCAGGRELCRIARAEHCSSTPCSLAPHASKHGARARRGARRGARRAANGARPARRDPVRPPRATARRDGAAMSSTQHAAQRCTGCSAASEARELLQRIVRRAGR